MDVGQRLKYLRQQANISGKALAKLVNLDASQISKIENNATKPSLDALERICAALGVNLSDFFTDDQKQKIVLPEVNQVIGKVKKLPPQKLKVLNDVLDTWVDDTE